MTPGFEYTVATGHLFCNFNHFQAEAEKLLVRPIFTHELGREETWGELRQALEKKLIEEFRQ